MRKLSGRITCWLIALACVGCAKQGGPAVGPAVGGASASSAAGTPPVLTEPTPTPTGTAAMLLRPKTTDDEFQAAIVVLQAADVVTDVATAVTNGDHRVFAIQGVALEAPGVAGDWRALPKGAFVVTVAGTSAQGGSKYQQRFQVLAQAYAAKYNPLLLSRLQ